MSARKIHWFVLPAILMWFVEVPAQPSDTSILDDQLFADTRAQLQAGRRDIIAEELRLTEAEAAAFWPVYEDYEADTLAVRDQNVEVIASYLRRYRSGDVTADYADELLEEGLAFKEGLLKIQKRYVRKFRKTLPVRKLVRFYQLENKMDAEIDAQLAVVIPLIDII